MTFGIYTSKIKTHIFSIFIFVSALARAYILFYTPSPRGHQHFHRPPPAAYTPEILQTAEFEKFCLCKYVIWTYYNFFLFHQPCFIQKKCVYIIRNAGFPVFRQNVPISMVYGNVESYICVQKYLNWEIFF